MFFWRKRKKKPAPSTDASPETEDAYLPTSEFQQEESQAQSSAEYQSLQGMHDTRQRYRLVNMLGEGGFAVVDACFDELLNRVVAVKSVRDENRLKPEYLQLILNEARLISYLNHPGIVSIYDAFFEPDGSFSYTMNPLEGETLAEQLGRFSGQQIYMPVAVAQQIIIRICETLAYAHDRGVLHLDVKPANVMLGRYGEVLIMDWGTACLYDSSSYKQHIFSYGKKEDLSIYEGRDGKKMGTLPFMAPEQLLQPRHTLTPSADIFAVGVLFYMMLAGKSPYPTSSPDDFWMAAHKNHFVPLHAIRGDIPTRLSTICTKMMQNDTKKRYQSLHDVLRDLRDFSDSGRSFELRIYEPGEVILKEGEPGDYALQILEGSVEIVTEMQGERIVLATRTKGNVVGEMAVFTNEPRSATVVARHKTIAKLMAREDILKELDKLDPWVGYTVKSLSQRLLKDTQK